MFEIFESPIPDLHRVGAVSDAVEAALRDGSGKNGGCGGPVTSLLVRLIGNVLPSKNMSIKKKTFVHATRFSFSV
jgi:hypothetical protein